MGFKNVALLASTFLSTAFAQFGGWGDDQINTTICTWSSMRAALIRDTIYMDGGLLTWIPGNRDGSYGETVPETGVQRLILTFNLSNPVDVDTNVTALLFQDPLIKQAGGVGAKFEDGAMLANDNQFMLYGGNIQRLRGSYSPPDSDEITGYQLYRYGTERTWVAGWDDVDLGDEVNRYVAWGGGVSAPSENKAWYFSGMTAEEGGEIEIGGIGNGSTLASVISKRFIQVDMTKQSSEVWTNKTLPSDVDGRASPEVIWVPVGDEGILVVLGGVVDPQWGTIVQQSEDPDRSERESPRFMREIDIYDIAGDNWYKQNTTDGPGARTRGCAVLATAADRSSFNIYYYGGFDGISPVDPFYDDVWVLSLPSFTWTRLDSGTETHARAAHRCFTPYADQMLVAGGYRSLSGSALNCLEDGVFAFFNLTSGEWMNSYHPEQHGEYGVPEKVYEVIGGGATGSATLTVPSPSGWDDEDLGEVFSKPYDTTKISAWGPFSAAETSTEETSPPESDDDGDDDGGDGGLPSWVAPVLGVVLGLMALTGALIVFFIWRKRKFLKNNPNASNSEASTEDTGKRVRQWITGQPSAQQHAIVEKAPTVTTEETPSSPETRSVSAMRSDTHSAAIPEAVIFYHETAGNPVAELPDTSRAEMSSDVHSDDFRHDRTSYYAEHGRSVSPPDPSHDSVVRGPFEAADSSVSGSSAAAAAAAVVAGDQTESPVVRDQFRYRRSDSAHMRSVSETLDGPLSMKSAQDTHPEQGEASKPSVAAKRQSEQISEAPVSPPTSPPTSGDFQGEDYLAAKSNFVSPTMRKSAFQESGDDLEKK